MVSSFSEFHFIVCDLLATGFVMWIWKELVDQILLLTRSLQGSWTLIFKYWLQWRREKKCLDWFLISLTSTCIFIPIDGFEVGRKR